MKIVIDIPPKMWAQIKEGHAPVDAYECIEKGQPLRCLFDKMKRKIKDYTFTAHGTKFIYIDRLNHILNEAKGENNGTL